MFNPNDWEDNEYKSKEKYIEHRLNEINTFAAELRNIKIQYAKEILNLVPGISRDGRKQQTDLQMKARFILDLL